MARVTLKPAPVRFPLVLLWLARELALVNEPLLVLLGVVPCSADWFLMDVVLWSFVYLLEPRCRMFVDLEVVLVKCPLPGFCTLIEDCCIGGPGGIPLPPPEVGLAAWCIWGPLVLVDVQRCDAEVLIKALGKVFEAFPFAGISPSFPN